MSGEPRAAGLADPDSCSHGYRTRTLAGSRSAPVNARIGRPAGGGPVRLRYHWFAPLVPLADSTGPLRATRMRPSPGTPIPSTRGNLTDGSDRRTPRIPTSVEH